MKKLLTISIAAYNQEKYIKQTLDSLIDETIIDELEIFVVDDGANDHSLEIAQQYAAKYPQSIFPIHKENGGYGSTVNYSIAHMSGKYFRMLDGDDWYETKEFCNFVLALKNTDADVVITPYYEGITGKMKCVRWDVPWGETIRIESMDARQTFGMWAITYKSDVIRKSGMVLPPMFYIDQIYNIVPFAYSETISFLNHAVYCYRTGQEGQSISRAARIRHTCDILNLCVWQCDFYEKLKSSCGKNLNYIASRIGGDAYQFSFNTLIMYPVSKDNLNRLIEFEKTISRLSPDIYNKAKEVGRWRFFIYLLRKTNYRLYWFMRFVPDGFLYKIWWLYKRHRLNSRNTLEKRH